MCDVLLEKITPQDVEVKVQVHDVPEIWRQRLQKLTFPTERHISLLKVILKNAFLQYLWRSIGKGVLF